MDFWRELETELALPEVHVVIETPKGNENKYEYDAAKRALVLDGVLYSAMPYQGPDESVSPINLK